MYENNRYDGIKRTQTWIYAKRIEKIRE